MEKWARMNSWLTNSETLFLVLDAIVKIVVPVIVGYLAWQVRQCQVDVFRLRARCADYDRKLHELSCACEAGARSRDRLAEEIKTSRVGFVGKELLDKASAPAEQCGKLD